MLLFPLKTCKEEPHYIGDSGGITGYLREIIQRLSVYKYVENTKYWINSYYLVLQL